VAIYKEQGFAERRQAAMDARKALLEKAKAQMPSADDPAVQARRAERKAAAEARAQRQAEREREKREKAEREARERAEREAAAEAAAKAEAEAKENAEKDMVSRLLADEGRTQGQARCALRRPQGPQALGSPHRIAGNTSARSCALHILWACGALAVKISFC
jgi:hypothetical protein